MPCRRSSDYYSSGYPACQPLVYYSRSTVNTNSESASLPPSGIQNYNELYRDSHKLYHQLEAQQTGLGKEFWKKFEGRFNEALAAQQKNLANWQAIRAARNVDLGNLIREYEQHLPTPVPPQRQERPRLPTGQLERESNAANVQVNISVRPSERIDSFRKEIGNIKGQIKKFRLSEANDDSISISLDIISDQFEVLINESKPSLTVIQDVERLRNLEKKVKTDIESLKNTLSEVLKEKIPDNATRQRQIDSIFRTLVSHTELAVHDLVFEDAQKKDKLTYVKEVQALANQHMDTFLQGATGALESSDRQQDADRLRGYKNKFNEKFDAFITALNRRNTGAQEINQELTRLTKEFEALKKEWDTNVASLELDNANYLKPDLGLSLNLLTRRKFDIPIPKIEVKISIKPNAAPTNLSRLSLPEQDKLLSRQQIEQLGIQNTSYIISNYNQLEMMLVAEMFAGDGVEILGVVDNPIEGRPRMHKGNLGAGDFVAFRKNGQIQYFELTEDHYRQYEQRKRVRQNEQRSWSLAGVDDPMKTSSVDYVKHSERFGNNPTAHYLTPSTRRGVVTEMFGKHTGDSSRRGVWIIDNQEHGTKGVFDVGDILELYYDEQGNLAHKRIDEHLFKDIMLRVKLVESADLLQARETRGNGIKFASQPSLGRNQQEAQANPLWEIKDGRLSVKSGKKASEAIDDIFINGNRYYAFDCATLTNLVGLRATMESLGREEFDRLHPGFSIQGWSMKRNAGGVEEQALSQVQGISTVSTGRAATKPGEIAYITSNLHMGDQNANSARQAGYGGLNCIYLGNGQYFAGPPCLVGTAEQLSRGFAANIYNRYGVRSQPQLSSLRMAPTVDDLVGPTVVQREGN